jgi:hypothetical protein
MLRRASVSIFEVRKPSRHTLEAVAGSARPNPGIRRLPRDHAGSSPATIFKAAPRPRRAGGANVTRAGNVSMVSEPHRGWAAH